MLDPTNLTDGATISLGSESLDRAAIMDFARAYDPQPWHLDDAAAKASVFGALCASGWHSCAWISQRLVAAFRPYPSALVTLGETRWIKPVFPGEALALQINVVARREQGLLIDLDLDLSLVTDTGQAKVRQSGTWRLGPMGIDLALVTEPPGPRPGDPDPVQPITTVWFEDVADHGVRTYARRVITAEDVATFTALFPALGVDHDQVPAWLIPGLWMRLTVDQSLGGQNEAAAGSPGFKSLSWPTPAKIGDVVTCRTTQRGKTTFKSRQDIGLVHSHSEVIAGDGRVLMRFDGQGLVRRKPNEEPKT